MIIVFTRGSNSNNFIPAFCSFGQRCCIIISILKNTDDNKKKKNHDNLTPNYTIKVCNMR